MSTHDDEAPSTLADVSTLRCAGIYHIGNVNNSASVGKTAGYDVRVRALASHAVALAGGIHPAADALGVSFSCLSRLATERPRNPFRLVEALERAFGCKIDEAVDKSGVVKPGLRLMPADESMARELFAAHSRGRGIIPTSADFDRAEPIDRSGWFAAARAALQRSAT